MSGFNGNIWFSYEEVTVKAKSGMDGMDAMDDG